MLGIYDEILYIGIILGYLSHASYTLVMNQNGCIIVVNSGQQS